MKIGLETRHFPRKKPSVLTDAVATDGRYTLRDPLMKKGQRLCLGLLNLKGTLKNPRYQTRLTMMGPVPLVHTIKYCLRLVDDQLRTLGNDHEILVGHQRCDLDDVILKRIQPGHFKIDPDEILGMG